MHQPATKHQIAEDQISAFTILAIRIPNIINEIATANVITASGDTSPYFNQKLPAAIAVNTIIPSTVVARALSQSHLL